MSESAGVCQRIDLIPRRSTNFDNLNCDEVESIPKLSGLKQIGHIFQNAKHGFQTHGRL